ncbi:hypothetical protein N9L68_02535 [bacterium]|nr:hypothetical protein [bacterium]
MAKGRWMQCMPRFELRRPPPPSPRSNTVWMIQASSLHNIPQLVSGERHHTIQREGRLPRSMSESWHAQHVRVLALLEVVPRRQVLKIIAKLSERVKATKVMPCLDVACGRML